MFSEKSKIEETKNNNKIKNKITRRKASHDRSSSTSSGPPLLALPSFSGGSFTLLFRRVPRIQERTKNMYLRVFKKKKK
jgi:hypothetical protein